jgi:hypothetical protein
MRIPRGGTWPLAVVVLVVCAGCAAPPVSPQPDPGGQATVSPEPDEGVQVLAKANGWRWSQADFYGLAHSYGFADLYGVVEVAYDEVTAAQAWEQNVPADLDRRSGHPTLTGLYGDLADIDFDREALVVYSEGQSGSCPGWLTGIEVTEQGTVQLTTTFTSTTFATVQGERVGECTADYRPYRLLLAVDRDRLPPISGLPTTRVLFNGEHLGAGGLVTTYPAEAG